MQWPYTAWGATAVLSGHQHSYERINRDDTGETVETLPLTSHETEILDQPELPLEDSQDADRDEG